MRAFQSQSHHWLSACAFAVALTVAVSSAAQVPGGAKAPGKDDALSNTARELFRKGVKAQEQQKWDDCCAALLAALSIKRHWQIAGNLAMCEAKLGRYRDAAEHASSFLSEMEPTATDGRAEGEAILKESLGKIAAVTVRVTVAGAEVVIDGRPAGPAPLAGPVFLDPGKHTFEARQDGYAATRTTLEAQAGTKPELTLRLEKLEAVGGPPSPPAGEQRWQPKPPAGEQQWQPNRAALIVGGVATGFTIGLGVLFTVVANGKASAAEAKRDEVAKTGGMSACTGSAMSDDCKALHGLWADRATFSNVAVWSFLSAGVLGAATIAVTLVGTKQTPEKAGVRVVPSVGLGTGGISVRGAW